MSSQFEAKLWIFWFFLVFWNADGLTQFGTPFEIRTQLNYFILRKGGNVDGYSALFAFIPNLRLGLSNI